jgi:hypothetical protein
MNMSPLTKVQSSKNIVYITYSYKNFWILNVEDFN